MRATAGEGLDRASAVTITPVRGVELGVSGRDWRFADARREAIERNFAALRSQKPALFNGPMYMLRQHAIEGGMFRGTVSRVDYASYLYWRERRELDRSIRNVFGAAALHSADGALLLGIMGPHTANAGLIYPPSGSPDDKDVKAGRLDLLGNIAREVAEETGIALALPDRPSWLALEDGPRLALLLPVSLPCSADQLAGRVERHLAREPVPELSGIHVVRGRGDIVPERMQPYTLAYIHHVFAS